MSRSSSPDAPPTKTRVTLSDVAQAAGVSVSVVSRELNGDPALRARPETRQRVRQAAEALGYTPSHAARSLRLAKAFAIGLLVPELTSPIYDPLIRGVEDTAERLGYRVIIGRTERIEPGADFLRRLAGEGRADGFLVQRRDEMDPRDFASLIETGSPVVLVNSRGRRRGSAVLDDAAGARMATEHLLQLGHRDIALIGGDEHSYTGKERERGFVRAIRAAGMRKRSAWLLRSGYTPEAGRLAVRRLCVTTGRRPTAVVAANMIQAVGALLGAREIGLKVPEQLSVIAIHDCWVAGYSRPRLTTIRMPMYQLGQEAMRLLHLRLTGERAQDVMVTEPLPALIERESIAPPPRRLIRGRVREDQATPEAALSGAGTSDS
ncbi:MAG: LacI family DNA-binding transcriptional regulator [Chloroflexota bacterium]|nr:LacI family DNA-binding transcriptional regulator [Chloroflexota bacterium]